VRIYAIFGKNACCLLLLLLLKARFLSPSFLVETFLPPPMFNAKNSLVKLFSSVTAVGHLATLLHAVTCDCPPCSSLINYILA
jgi:hypothetical protein